MPQSLLAFLSTDVLVYASYMHFWYQPDILLLFCAVLKPKKIATTVKRTSKHLEVFGLTYEL
jgi:hypothetical protein